MIQFDTLKFVDDKLTIVASVKDETYYTDVYIDKIVIDNQDTFLTSGTPSSSPKYSYTVSGSEKSVTITLSTTNIDTLNTDLLCVYAVAKGTPSSDVPCGGDNVNTLGIVYNKKYLCQDVIDFLKELDDVCMTPKEVIDFILRYNALNLSIENEDYVNVIKFWKYLNNETKPVTTGCGCGCYGNK